MAFLAENENGTEKYLLLDHYIGGERLKAWIYITTDDSATVTGAGYFNSIQYLQTVVPGDEIKVYQVTDPSDLATIFSRFDLIVTERLGSTVTVELFGSDLSIASQAQAEAGTSNGVIMSPLRSNQHFTERLTGRNRVEGYTPAYTLSTAHVEGGGTDLSVHFPFDMGTHTIPTGANKQHVGIRFIGDFTSGDATETAGVRAISFDLTSRNCDAYGMIGVVTLASGSKGVKGIYGRAICASTDADAGGDNGGFGLVGAVTVSSGSTATSAWSLQLTQDGAGSLGTAANQRFISLGTDQSTKVVGYGVFSDPKLSYSTAFIRAFWTSGVSGPFLQWQEKDGGGAGVHTDLFKVTSAGLVQAAAGTASAPGLSFHGDTNSGIYGISDGVIGIATQGTLRLQVNASGHLQFAGATSSFPALKRSSAILQTRLADDSDFAIHECEQIKTNNGVFLVSGVALTDGAAAETATLTNGPAAGNPTKWVPIDDNGTTRYIPAW